MHCDLIRETLSVSTENVKKLKGEVSRFLPAAVYDLHADEPRQTTVNNKICGRDHAKLDEAYKDAIARGYCFIAYAADMVDCDHLTNALVTDT